MYYAGDYMEKVEVDLKGKGGWLLALIRYLFHSYDDENISKYLSQNKKLSISSAKS